MIRRRVFFSFDWDNAWRVMQVRNSCVTKDAYEARFANAAQVEEVKRKTDVAIKNWIAKQLDGASVTCVLIGTRTIKSRWVRYEIKESVRLGKGLLGVYIHNIKDSFGKRAIRGDNPLPKEYPPYATYDWIYGNGYENIAKWINDAAEEVDR